MSSAPHFTEELVKNKTQPNKIFFRMSSYQISQKNATLLYGQLKNRILVYSYTARQRAKEQDTGAPVYGQLKISLLL